MMIRLAVFLLIAFSLTVPTRVGLSGGKTCPSQTSAWSCPADFDQSHSLAETSAERPCPSKAMLSEAGLILGGALRPARFQAASDDAPIETVAQGLDRPPKPSTV